jgi:hypothetical protein
MKSKIWLAGALLLGQQMFGCDVVQAGVITAQGYTKAENSDIIQGEGLEWLAWSSTRGMSISQALTKYQQDGWQLASNQQMAALMNKFQFGKQDWSDAEVLRQDKSVAWDASESSPHLSFVSLFGRTVISPSCSELGRQSLCYLDNDRSNASNAFFGSDQNKNGKYNSVYIADDTSNYGFNGLVRTSHQAFIGYDIHPDTQFDINVGVALVRTTNTVPAPAPLGLIGLMLIALGLKRRR